MALQKSLTSSYVNLFAIFAAGYIALTTAVREDGIFLVGIKECFKRIYGMSKFIFYAIGYALERILSMSRSGISAFLSPKVKSQQLNLFDYFKIADGGT